MRDKSKIAKLIEELLLELGVDMDEGDVRNTPERVARSLMYLTEGYVAEMPKVKTFEHEGNQVVHIGGMSFASLCEHHMLPFIGEADIWYVPDGKVIGLSKPARILDWLARRLCIQERLTKQFFDVLWNVLKPKALVVRIKAWHTCSSIRGVKCADMNIETWHEGGSPIYLKKIKEVIR